MKHNMKWIISLVVAVAAVGAAITAVVVFWDRIRDLFERCPKPSLHSKEFDDYADVEYPI